MTLKKVKEAKKNDVTYALPLRRFADRHNTFLNIYNKSEDEVLRLLVSKLPRMGRFICQYIKRDSSMCGKGCMSDLGCFRHLNTCPKTICPICKELTYSDTGICSTHSRFYDRAWRKSKKTKTESNMIKT